MTMDDIRRMEEETKAELDKVINCRTVQNGGLHIELQ